MKHACDRFEAPEGYYAVPKSEQIDVSNPSRAGKSFWPPIFRITQKELPIMRSYINRPKWAQNLSRLQWNHICAEAIDLPTLAKLKIYAGYCGICASLLHQCQPECRAK